MEPPNENLRLPQWVSITGQPLELGLESGFQGLTKSPIKRGNMYLHLGRSMHLCEIF